MTLRHWAAAAAISLGIAGAAYSEDYMQTADPQVVQALNDMIQVYGGLCQQGNPQGCNMMQYIQQTGGQMLRAGNDCQVNGSQQACQFYQQAYRTLEQAYYETEAAVNRGQFSSQQPGYSALAHQQRMQEIDKWGQQRLQWGQNQSNMMDQRHQQFLEYLRQ